MGRLPAWGLDEGLTTPQCKQKKLFTKCYTGPRILTDSPERPRQRKMDMNPHRTGLLKTVASELVEWHCKRSDGLMVTVSQ
jgi:hypothetical protein